MIRILYKDCNNNAAFLKGLFIRVNEFLQGELNWNITNIEFSVVYRGDFFNGIPPAEMEEIYKFQKESFDKHTLNINHDKLIDLFDDIQTIYEGEFLLLVNDNHIKIKVFDGDIIEIDGYLEEQLLNTCEKQEDFSVCKK